MAQFDRAMIKDRQREGIAKAKEKGVYKGRTKTVDDEAIRAAIARDGVTKGLSFRKPEHCTTRFEGQCIIWHYSGHSGH